MEFKHIEYFITASRHQSMSQAAESLYISQQALSRCIQNLETELGCRLFNRTVKGSTLTAEGQYLYSQFNPLVESYHQTVDEALAHLSAQPRKIAFASAPLIFGMLETSILYTYHESQKKTSLDIQEMSDTEVEQYVARDASHFGILAEPEHWHGRKFDYTPVRTYPLSLCIHKNHPLAKKRSVSFGDLRDEYFLVLDKRSHYQTILREKAKEYGFEPNFVFESADVNQLCALVNANKGIFIAVANPAFGTLFKNIQVVALKDKDMTYSITFIYQKLDKLEPQARKFIEFIKNHAYDEGEGGLAPK